MKKQILLFIAFLSIFGTSTLYSQIKFGVKAGVNFSNPRFDPKISAENDIRTYIGYHFGPTIAFSLSDHFSLESAVLYTLKGVKTEVSSSLATAKAQTTFNYLEIPINALYRLNFGSISVPIFAGPYLGYAISGKTKGETTVLGVTEKFDYKLTIGNNEDDDLKPFDFGLNFGTGIEYKSLSLTVQYGLGLANIVQDSGTDQVANNRVLGISLGYKF